MINDRISKIGGSYEIAICDDEQVICGQLEDLLLKIGNDLAIKMDVDTFNSGEKLCYELSREKYDLIF